MIEIRVYGADLRQVAAEACRPLLDCVESQRANAICHAAARLEFVKTRALLRLALADATGRRPETFLFVTGKNGKPYLAETGGSQFNVSHAGGRAMIAVARCAVGVDIEAVDSSVDHLNVGETVYSEAECALLAKADEARRGDVFLTLWTRKEAYLKATGCGFSSALKKISTIASDGAIEDRSEEGGAAPWYAFDLPGPRNFKAALVAPVRDPEIVMVEAADWLPSGFRPVAAPVAARDRMTASKARTAAETR